MCATILVVEDDGIVAESIRAVLLGAGYDVPETAPSGESALGAAARIEPRLVLMDIQLDGPVDGIETARRLREEFGVRVIYLTGSTDEETLSRAKETAPLGYLKKPFNARELRIAVEIALQQAGLESALAAREQWFATTLESIGDAVLTNDTDQQVTFLNSAAETLLGVSRDEALGRPLGEVVRLVDENDAAFTKLVHAALHERVTTPLPLAARLRPRRALGDASTPDLQNRGPARSYTECLEIEVEGTVAPINGAGGVVAGSVMVFRDVRTRRRLERRLAMAERLAAIGTMAAGMQHEINNPLATIMANIHYALDVIHGKAGRPPASLADLGEIAAALQDASEGAERVRRTVDDLKHISRGDDIDKRPIQLTAALEQAVRATANAVRHHATIRRDYAPAPPVVASEAELTRVFMNLILNAAQAMGDGDAEHHTILLTTTTDAVGRAIVEVHDDGPGIPNEVLHRIFDPFFTPHVPKQSPAVGLALSMCHAIVTSLGGEIEADSEVGRGTTFRVSLPPAPVTTSRAPTLPPARPGEAPIASAARRGKILVIDDEPSIGKAIRRILIRDHDVTLQTDAREALVLLADETFDVVFCDLMMPRMSGMDFFDAVSRTAPPQAKKIVFLTGGAFSPRSEEFLQSIENPCLPKPFSREIVTSVVRSMVGE